jgi:hypothetical protein
MVYVSTFSAYDSSTVKTVFRSRNKLLNNTTTITTIREFELIKQLTINKTIIAITRYYTNFSLGNFDLVINELNPIRYSKISKELANLHAGTGYPEYEFILTNIIRSFESLMQSIDLYKKLRDTTVNLKYLYDRVSILDDRQKLQKYIDDLNNKSHLSLFPDINIEAPILTIKKEYDIYINLYGFPPGGVFNADLLGEIMNTMNTMDSC